VTKKNNQKIYFFTLISAIFVFIIIAIFARKKSTGTFQKSPITSPWSYQSNLSLPNTTVSVKTTQKSGVVNFQYQNSSVEFDVPLENPSIKNSQKNEIHFVTSKNNTEAQYQTLDNGLKENLIIKKTPTTNQFVSSFKTTNAEVYLNSSQLPVFLDPKTKEYLFHVQKPYAFDAAGNKTYAITYQLFSLNKNASSPSPTPTVKSPLFLLNTLKKTNQNSSYQLVVKVDSNWLFSKDRVYPITIDPTIVHDTQSEFTTGQFNRVKDTGSVSSQTTLAIGGTVTFSGGYAIHTFLSGTASFTPLQDLTVDILVVAGGGGGGGSNGAGGGGGAGGLIYNTGTTLANQSYSISIGSGGAGSGPTSGTGGNGSNSSFGNIIVTTGGGGGGGYNGTNTTAPNSGGSGGGGGSSGTGTFTGAAGTLGQGYSGGNGLSSGTLGDQAGAGGGGASQVGTSSTVSGGGNGGNGTSINISGSEIFYAGGGGGGKRTTETAGIGGTGGGGNGGLGAVGSAGTNGLGAGGGGGANGYSGGNGGSGIVIIRYPYSATEIAPNLESYYQELPADQYTVGLWHLNETVGTTVADSSGNGNTGTLSGTSVVDGLLGKARTFNGSSDSVVVNTTITNGLSKITIEGWIYSTAIKTYNTIVAKHNFASASGTSFICYLNSTNNLLCFISNGSTQNSSISPQPISLNTWHHFAVTYDGSYISLYVDGVMVDQDAQSGNLPASSYNLRFGDSDYSSGTDLFTGYIDEIRISSIARTPEEIKFDASRRPYSTFTSDIIDLSNVSAWNSLSWTASGLPTSDGETPYSSSGLVAQWNFNESSGTSAVSGGTCGSTCNGTLTNFANTSGQDVGGTGDGWTYNNRRWGSGALSLDGVDDYISIGNTTIDNPLKNNSFTIAGWINTKLLSPEAVIIHRGLVSSASIYYGIVFDLDNTGLVFSRHVGTTIPQTLTYSFTPNLNTWYYAVVTYDSSSGQSNLYLNGNQVKSGTLSTSNVSFNATYDAGYMIGGLKRNISDRYTSGTVDSISIYSRVLTASEILSNYNSSRLEFQTRVGNTTDANDGSWENWKPSTSESTLDNLDTSFDKWLVDNNQSSSNTISKTIETINTGTGNDGDCIMNNGTKTLDSTVGSSVCNGSARSTAYAINTTSTVLSSVGTTAITVGSTSGFAIGDEFLIINLQGTSTSYESVGKYETHIISSFSGNTIYFTDYALQNVYDGTTQKIMVQRVPNFGNVTICGGNTGGGCTAAATLNTTAWNGTKNGVLFFRSNGSITVNSGATITASSLGYRGGSSVSTYGQTGESLTPAVYSISNNNGGGGGGANAIPGAHGMGGGFGTNGGGGYPGYIPGIPYGASTPARIFLGSGGGTCFTAAGSGGIGGGAIALFSNLITVSGTITSNGQNGQGSACSGTYTYGEGAGSGGSIFISANTVTLGSSLVTANGGTGVSATYPGGNGGTGRITVYYLNSISGITSPIYSSQKIQTQTQTKIEGTGAMQISVGIPQVDSSTIGLWHLDETNVGTGITLLDSSGNNNYGIATGTTAVDGISNKARFFNGSSYISIGTTANLNPTSQVTVEAWVKVSGTVGAIQTIYDRLESSHGFGLYLSSSGNPVFGINGSAGAATSAIDIDNNQWHYIVGTYNKDSSSAQIKIFVDGIQQGTGTYTTAISYSTPPRNQIGRMATSSYFTGIIDEIRISNVARTAEEITESYRSGRDYTISKIIPSTNLSSSNKIPFYIASDRLGTFSQFTVSESAFANYEPDTNTVGLWHLDEQSGSGAYLKDFSGHGNNGTPTGTTFTQGKIGKGRYFAGSSSHIITIPDSTNYTFGTGDFSVESWAFPITTTGNYEGIISTYSGSSGFILATSYGTDGHISWWNTTNGWIDTGVSLSLNSWNHLVVTRTSGTVKLYLNGTLISSTNNWTGSIDGTNLIIGGWSTSYAYFTGIIDEVRVSNVARTADEIRQAYEIGARTHDITIDFKAKLNSDNLITNSSDYSFIIDETPYGSGTMASHLFLGDKIIIKENIGGTEFIAQGTVNSVINSTGSVTVSSWDSASTFPSSGFTISATVFKWQQEYFDITQSLSTQRDAVTRLSYRLTDGAQGANIWLDDIKSSTGYLNNSVGSTIVSSTLNRYFQYRVILTQNNYSAPSSALNSITLDYSSNTSPTTPTLDLPSNGASNQGLYPTLKTTSTDAESDYLRYKITLCSNPNMVTSCQIFDQTVSQVGWSGTYITNTPVSFTLISPLLPNTTYYWKSIAIDPAGSNTWSSTQSNPYQFTTGNFPSIDTGCLLEKSPLNNSINIKWSDQSNNEDGFAIERKIDGGSYSSLTNTAANTTNYLDSTTSSGHTYQYRIAPYTGSNYNIWCETPLLNLQTGTIKYEGIIFH
jgi:hypothetical protein